MSKGFVTPVILITLFVVVLVGGIYYYQNIYKVSQINSFDDCVKAGNPIMESYPAQCRVGDKTFVQPLSEEEQKKLQPPTKACTLEAKICPDGSSVGRTGPNCEFTACPAGSSTKTPTQSTNWKPHTSNTHGFSMKLHPDVVVENRAQNEELFRIWGPTQEEGQGFHDGLWLLFNSGDLQGKTLKSYVEDQINNSVSEIISPLKEVTLGGKLGYEYTSGGFGVTRNIYLPKPNNRYLVIGDSTIDPSNKGFKGIGDEILSTLNFN